MTDDNDVLAVLEPSPLRYRIGIGLLVGLGLLLLYLAATAPAPGLLAKLVLAAFGAAALFQGYSLYRAGRRGIVLTKDGVFDTAGNALCSLDQIAGVDRSAFAFKPSNGFVLKLNANLGRAWHPGLWWRLGKRIGVGGITSGQAGKNMADIIALIVRDRDSDDPIMPDLLKK